VLFGEREKEKEKEKEKTLLVPFDIFGIVVNLFYRRCRLMEACFIPYHHCLIASLRF